MKALTAITIAVGMLAFGGMTPGEALWAATAGGARALRRQDIGQLNVGAVADVAILDAPSYLHLAYRPGVPIVQHVLLNGEPT